MIYGYGRVSKDGQCVSAQVEALTSAGAVRVFRETASGARTNRRPLRRMIDPLATRLDRPARSTRDLFNTVAEIAGKGMNFRRLACTRVDPSTAHERLILSALGGLAKFEPDLIRARAKVRGRGLGRSPKLTPFQQAEALDRLDRGESCREIARSYTVSRSTVSRLQA